MYIKNRIKEMRQVKASELKPNPKNWRCHNARQSDAIRGLLAEVGYAGAVLARETDGGLQLIDGHLRTEVSGDSEIPVLILDVNEQEADLILATFDPISSMANTNAEVLEDLLQNLQSNSDAVNELLEGLAKSNGIFDELPDDADGQEIDENIGDKVELICCPYCNRSFPK